MNRKAFFLCGLILVALGLGYLHLRLSEKGELLSPKVIGTNLGVNMWFPKAEASYNPLGAPSISAESAYFIDINSGEVLYQKDIHKRLPIASLTKIMTVIVTMENHNFSDPINVSAKASGMEPDKMQLVAGETLSVEEIMYGIFLVSANDGAQAFCESFVSCDDFVKLMNKKAEQLGMKDSLFINPSGLEEDGRDQYSSAYDVALMSRYAITHFPHLVDISSTPHIQIPQTATHQDYEMYSGINLLTTYPGVEGFKTGYTPEAGLTLVTLAEGGGHTVLGVLLNSNNRREEARELLDFSFKKLGVSVDTK